MICFIADVTLSGTPKKDPSHASHSLPNNQILKKSFVYRPKEPQGMPSTRAKPQRLHQALSCCSNNKALLYPIKKRVCARQPILPLLRLCFPLFCMVSCFVFCLVFCLFSAMCSDFFLPCFLIADDILTRDSIKIRFCA